jgi:hypothetical protein
VGRFIVCLRRLERQEGPNRKLIDGRKDKWKPNLDVLKAVVKATGRLLREVVGPVRGVESKLSACLYRVDFEERLLLEAMAWVLEKAMTNVFGLCPLIVKGRPVVAVLGCLC